MEEQMQDNVLVGRVLRMPVAFPIPSVLVDFNISRKFLAIDEDQARQKSGPGSRFQIPK